MRLHLVVLGALPLLALAAAGMPAHAAPAPQVGQRPDTAAPAAGGPSQDGTAVIRPPTNVDPGINKAPSNAASNIDKMPVVTPPGTPGGDPTVIPK